MMTENEFLTLENLVHIRAALAMLNQITHGYGITEDELKTVKGTLLGLTTRISNSLDVEEKDEQTGTAGQSGHDQPASP